MKINKLWLLIAIAAIGLVGFMPQAEASHPGGNVTLLDEAGISVVGTTNPYSPKRTCARACHVSELPAAMQAKYPAGFPGHNYESHMGSITKQHTQKHAGALPVDPDGDGVPGITYSYSVPVPTKGISTSYHVQQGRNVAWGPTQRDFFSHYLTFGFASSNSMYGKA